MAVFHSAWLLGSVRDLAAQNFQADGVGASVAAGTYYLESATTALSLCQKFRAALLAAGVSGATVTLTRSRQIYLTAAETFTIDWGSATRLRDLLGFDADLADDDTHLAPLVSPLLWSPAKPSKSEMSPIGIRGITKFQSYFAAAPSDGSTTVVTHGERDFQKLSWLCVGIDRVFTPDQLGGEFVRFFREVLATGASLYHFRDIVEDTASSTVAVSLNPVGLGPYVYSPSSRSASWVYDRARGFEWTDKRADIDLPLHVVPEYEM